MEYRYTLDELGDLVLMDGDDVVLSIHANDSFAIFYDTDGRHDSSMATVLRHGASNLVNAAYQQHLMQLSRLEFSPAGQKVVDQAVGIMGGGYRAPVQHEMTLMARSMAADLEMLVIPVAELNDDLLEEINACLAISGRVGKLRNRIEDLRQGHSMSPAL